MSSSRTQDINWYDNESKTSEDSLQQEKKLLIEQDTATTQEDTSGKTSNELENDHTIEQVSCTIPSNEASIQVNHGDQYGYKYCDTLCGFKYPWGVSVSSNGDMAVAEWGGNCVTITDQHGNHKLTFEGKGKDRLQNPWGVLYTENNHLLVTDSSRVLKYTPHGKLVKCVGSKGANQQQFDTPAGIVIHPHNGKIYVADSNNHRIQILNSDLSFHSTFGKKGSKRGRFYLPWDIGMDSHGMVYVTEGNSRIQKFTPEGHFVTAIGRKGGKEGEINRPASITVDKNDLLHVTDLYNNRLAMFNTSGEFLCCYGNENTKEGVSFNGPCGVTVKDGTLYVTDSWNNNVKIFKY